MGLPDRSEVHSQVTVCVKTFLRDQHVINCVQNVREYFPKVRIIVADDGEPAQRKTRVMEKFEVEHHMLPFGVGLSFGRNFMLDRVETEYALVIDDDILLTEDTRVEDMFQLLEKADIVGGALRDRGRMINYEGTFELADRELRMSRTLPDEFSKYRGIRYQPAHFVLNLLAVRASTLRDLRWDDRFRIAYEHIDLFMRAYDARLEVIYAPDSIFEHARSAFPTTSKYRQHRQSKESRPIFFEKWGITRVCNLQGHVETIEGVKQVVRKRRKVTQP